MAAYARKYAEGWERFADKFRAGFKDGSRVLIAYTPVPGRHQAGLARRAGARMAPRPGGGRVPD